MKIVVNRIAKKSTYTIGKLYINDKYFCDTLEDTDRNIDNNMSVTEITSKKIKGKTAIPTGTYQLSITYSPRFKKNMPLISPVKGFDGIRIHTGNTSEDTDGCLLLGENKVKGKVINSKVTYEKFFNLVSKEPKNTITITIK